MEDELSREIRAHCLRFLTRREYSQLELLTKLLDKGYTIENAKTVIEQLAVEGYQSDDRFVENYARYRIRKGFGPMKINYELQQKGIDESDLEAIVKDLTGTWLDLLKTVYHKKYQGTGSLSRQEWMKRSRYLQQRGFSCAMVMNLFKQLGVNIK